MAYCCMMNALCFKQKNMYVDDELIGQVAKEAQKSPRLRMHYDFRDSEEEGAQRMMNVMEVGTVLTIHRHLNSSETVILLRGHIIERFYDDNGSITAEYDLCPREGRYGVQVPKGVWHNFEVLEPSALFEAKDGRYFPLGEGGNEAWESS